eukprot:208733_1
MEQIHLDWVIPANIKCRSLPVEIESRSNDSSHRIRIGNTRHQIIPIFDQITFALRGWDVSQLFTPRGLIQNDKLTFIIYPLDGARASNAFDNVIESDLLVMFICFLPLLVS